MMQLTITCLLFSEKLFSTVLEELLVCSNLNRRFQLFKNKSMSNNLSGNSCEVLHYCLYILYACVYNAPRTGKSHFGICKKSNRLNIFNPVVSRRVFQGHVVDPSTHCVIPSMLPPGSDLASAGPPLTNRGP